MRIFADSGDVEEMNLMARNPLIRGFTTNPTLMRKAGVKDYKTFARRLLTIFPEYPISFEVIADDIENMEKQAKKLASWGENVYVKIPVCMTNGESTAKLIENLSKSGIKINVTAVFCYQQVDEAINAIADTPSIISVFAGRIADTGRDPAKTIVYALRKKRFPTTFILWASPRQVLDVYRADTLGCDIITVTNEILLKLQLEGKNLVEYSRDTVEMFYSDAKKSGFNI